MDSSTGKSTLFKIALAIAIVGALNWGLIGLFNWNLVDALFGGGARETTSAASRIVYALVGLAGLASIPLLANRDAADRRGHRMDVAPHSR